MDVRCFQYLQRHLRHLTAAALDLMTANVNMPGNMYKSLGMIVTTNGYAW